LAPGYGLTIGNSLRRVLLSSLPSSGICGIFIPGVKHEYEVITGIKEDVTHIIHNLKKIVFSMNTSAAEEAVVKINVTGPAEVLSDCIHSEDDNLTIINRDVYICSVMQDIKFECHIYIIRGQGYVGLDDKSKDSNQRFAGFIPVHSIPNAVTRASYEVNNINYAGYADYEELKMNVITNGTITPEEAIKKASSILVDNFCAISGINNNNIPIADKKLENQKEPEKRDSIMYLSIRSIYIPSNVCTVLEEAGICFVADLIKKTKSELLALPKLGIRKINQIHKQLQEQGLDFAQG
jgi:DNA-directed RNA polymerase subunit alpha